CDVLFRSPPPSSFYALSLHDVLPILSGMLGSAAPLVLANAKLRVEQTEEAFAFSVLSPERPAVVRRVELICPAWFREWLRVRQQDRESTSLNFSHQIISYGGFCLKKQ